MEKYPMVEKPGEPTPKKPVEEETTVEETPETPEEPPKESEETPKQTPPEEIETPIEETKKPEEYTDREKRYYARMKKAEADAKKVKEELAKANKTSEPLDNVDAIIEVQSATKGLELEEVAELKLRADVLNVSLSEARKDTNYVLWQTAWKEKVAKAKALAPNTNQDEVDKPKTLDERLEAAKTLKEKEEILSGVKFKDDDGSEGNINPMTIRDY